MIGNYDAAQRLLNSGEGNLNEKYPTFREKLDLFFIDYDWVPMLVQDGYLQSMKNRGEARDMDCQDIEDMANASEFISMGDTMNVKLRTDQQWSLLPNIGICGAVAPAIILKGKSFMPTFPQVLGKMSSMKKAKRQIKELKAVMGTQAQMNKGSIQHEMVPLILQMIYKKLSRPGNSGEAA